MKVLLVIFHGLSKSNGISKKILAQAKAFKELGLEAHLAHYDVNKDGSRCWLIDNNLLKNLGSGAKAKLKKRIDYSSISNYVLQNDISFVYIRSDHNANPFTIHFIKKLKKAGCRVVMEIPTYPYDQEYITWRMKLDLFVDRCFRYKLAKQLDAIVTFTSENEIFGQKTIQISNGIDFDSIPLRQHIPPKNGTIHLLGVAEIHYWHGFDRIIAGMAEYYKTNPSRKVYFHIIGKLSGKREKEEIMPPISQNHLEKFVLLHGALFGEKLDKMFNTADFAIGSLGRHRSGINSIRTLKNREYAARGIAFAYSETDIDFDDMNYVLKISADESPVSISSLLDFIDRNTISSHEIRNSIHHLSWRNQMQKVIDSLKVED